MTEPTLNESMVGFGNYRVLRSQQLCQHMFLPASVLMALGLRETGLKNICGGAKWDGKEWVQAYSDRGCFQISDKVSSHWLQGVPGCANGEWLVDGHHTALDAMHCPRFTDAAIYVIGLFARHRTMALHDGVKPDDLIRFCVAAHNAGYTGALKGYRNGDVDENTAHNNYSAAVMANSAKIHQWVLEHPKWRYKGQVLLEDEDQEAIF